MKKIHPAFPGLLTAAIALTAAALFFHTTTARHRAAQVPRLTAAEQASASAGQELTPGLPGHPLRSSTNASERRSVIGRRLDSIRTMADSLDRTRTLVALIRNFTAADFSQAIAACRPAADEEPDPAYLTILEEWSRRDPLAALTAAGQDAGMQAGVLATWAQTDPEAALNWARQHAGDDPAGGLAGQVIAAIARSNPKLAMDHLADLPEGARQDTINAIVHSGETASAQAVVDWIAAIKDPDERGEAARLTYDNWSSSDNLEQQYALFVAYPEALAGREIENLLRCWSFYDLPKVRAAIDLLPPGDLRDQAMSGTLSGLFMSGNAEGASEMLAAYRGDIDDTLLSHLIILNSEKYPLATLSQTGQIQDPALRDSSIAQVLYGWSHESPDAVREWMASHEVTSSVREEFQELSDDDDPREQAKLSEAVGR